MGSSPITLDPRTFVPFDQPNPAPTTANRGTVPAMAQEPAAKLHQSVAYGVQQDPVVYAARLDLQRKLGIPPEVSAGQETELQHAADLQSLNPTQFAAVNPRTTTFASDPDNAAVSGVDGIQNLAGIEQNGAGMRSAQGMFPAGTMSAHTPSLWEKTQRGLEDAYRFLTRNPHADLVGSLYQYPLTRLGIDAVGGAPGIAGNLLALGGVHGNGPSKENLLQRIETAMKPENNTDPLAEYHNSTVLDSLARNLGPLIPATVASGGTSLLARALSLSPTAAKVLSGLAVGGLFTADQGGQTYTSQLAAGKSEDDARLASNRVLLLNALPNALFGATDVVPFLRDNPLATAFGLGAATGASGQVAQNVVTGQPWAKGVPAAMVQGAAMQGGMHLGFGAFGGETGADAVTPPAPGSYVDHLAQAVNAAEQSPLRGRSPETFYEAAQGIFEGDASLRIPSDKFVAYFTGKGIDPQEVAKGLGATNFAEAVGAGGDVEVPVADFLSKLDSEHQKALLPDVVDPSTGLTARQHQEGREELAQWATNGGAEKLIAETAAADAETAASPEFQTVKEALRQKYEAAGETPEVAETLAEKDANVYSNLARNAGMKPSELLGLYNPKVVRGELPEAPVLHQEAIEKIRSVVEAANEPGDQKKWTVYAPASEWLRGAAKTAGLELDGFDHGIDADAIRHTKNHHGDAEAEANRGQVAITDGDFEKIPHIVSEPDRVVFGGKTNDGLDAIAYVKRLDDGTIAHVEEVRTGRKRLAAVSMWKYPAAMDVDSIAANLHPHVQDDGGRTSPIVVRGPEADKEESELHQSSAEGKRGWFRVLPDGSYEIGKTKIGDLSTFVHEPAHAYLKILGDLAKREGASDVLKGDYQKALNFLGAKDGDELTREQQETWARANEQYLREGRAPSPGLKGTFQRFAIWLGSVYKKATDLGVHLTDDIRGVFDRLYAAESGVERAEAEAGPKLFTTPEEAGWTEEQFRQYAEDNHMSAEQARADLLRRLNEAAVRERSQAWRTEEQNVRAAVTAQVDASPEYTAIRALRKGQLDDGNDLTINRDALVEQFGEQRIKALQKLHPGLYRIEGGIDPETAAEMLGFRSASELMTALEDVPRRSEAIDQITRAHMTAKHGDIRYDGTLDDQARIALENDRRADALHSELTALRKKLADAQAKTAGQKEAMRDLSIAPINEYRDAAHAMVEAKAVADLQPTRYLDASRKYSREAFDALRRGDTEAAAQAKHKELMNHFLFREATEAKQYIAKFESYAKRMQNKAVQSKLGLAGEDYREQFNRILGRYGLGPVVPAGERTLAEWAAAQYDGGKEPAIDPGILDETRSINYRNAPVSEVRTVHDALINIKKLAYLELEMEVNGRKVEFAKAVSSMASQAYESLKSHPRPVFEENRTTGEKVGDFVNRGTALLARTEFVMKQLDGGTSGPWHDNLWHLAADAQGKEYELHREVTKQVGNALANMPKEQRMKLLDKVTIDGVGEPLTRQRMIAIAFNTGNEGNLDRLTKTFIANDWNPHAIEQIKSTLTREEWKFVQGVWDSLKPLGKAQSELEERLTGLPPVMVTPTPLRLKLADGSEIKLDGGYYPIVYDPKRSTRGAQQDVTRTAVNLMESGYGRAATSRGNMQARSGYGGPLQLDYEQVLTQHTAKVIKDISHREFMLAANKLLMDPQTRQAVQNTLGVKSEAQLMPWLRTIVNDSNGSAVQGLGDVSRGMAALRTNVVKAALGFKFSTLLLQLTHASSIFLHTSPASYGQAMIDFLAHPKAMSEEIRQLSPNEMSSRGENLDRDMRKVLQDGLGKKGIGDMWAKAGMFPVQMMDHLLSFPLWSAVYRDALKANIDLPEAEAKYQAMQKADGAVRMGLGSNAPKDLAPIMRNHDLTKLLTTMGGFHNLKWNQMSDVVNSYRNGGNVGQLSYGLLMAAIIPAIMGPLITGHGPKDGENPAVWARNRALLFPLETISILGNVVEGIERKGDVSFSPIAGMLERAGKAVAHATSDSEEKDWTGIGLDTLQPAMEGLGVSGTDQAFKTARYLKQVQDGKISDPNAWDAVAGAPHPAHR